MTEHFDVLIVGAGLSGISSACHLSQRCPGRSYAILEGRASMGGTWDLFRYPGIRSDSDMFTLGYSFRPWTDPNAIADGGTILQYIKDTAQEYGVDRHIRYEQRVVRASWSSSEARWTLDVQQGPDRKPVRYTCNFLHMCSGYYRYEEGHSPEFRGRERFQGRIVHPQKWTEDIEYAGKRVVIIGSGATAVTLLPELAKQAEHVTMLQRSPTYMISRPAQDKTANRLRELLPEMLAYQLTRIRNVLQTSVFYKLSKDQPKLVRRWLIGGVLKQLRGAVEPEHFTPRYNPWDQRLCLVPDGDLFETLRAGKASVVTDHIDSFTERGIALKSGRELEADLIVTATGLHLQLFGGMELIVDGEKRENGELMVYRGMMFDRVPNMAVSQGYTNASWTLKCDLTCAYVCRLLNHMAERDYQVCTPVCNDPSVERISAAPLSSGYIVRAFERMPKAGNKRPWKNYQNYFADIASLRMNSLEDGTMRFERASGPVREAAPEAPNYALN